MISHVTTALLILASMPDKKSR